MNPRAPLRSHAADGRAPRRPGSPDAASPVATVATNAAHRQTPPARQTLPARVRSQTPVGPVPRLSDRDIELLFSQLAKMVGAGISLERALATTASGASSSPRGMVASSIVAGMRGGLPPAKAFASAGQNIDASCLALLRTGEMTGDLGPALAEIERLLMARNALRSKVTTALVYPAILAIVAFGSVLTILLVVVPQFEQLVRAHLDKLPASARFVFWLSDTVRQLAMPLAAALIAVLALAFRAARAGTLEQSITGVLRLTSFGSALIDKAQSAAMFRLVGTLVSRQVQLLPAIDVARQTITDPKLGAATLAVRERLKTGARLSDALYDTGAFPPIVVQLARAGEESGDLGSMLTKAAQMLEDDLERMTKLFLIWFEPMLLVVIGSLIGGLLYGLFSAILSINSII